MDSTTTVSPLQNPYVSPPRQRQPVRRLRVVIYARLSRNRRGLSTNTAIQVAECLEDAKDYAAERGMELEIVAIFEEDDVSASKYSTKPRPLYEQLLELIRANKVDVIWATENERLVRRPRETDELIDLAETTDLQEIRLTTDEGYDLRTPNGIYRARAAVAQAERESRKISERTRRKQANRAENGYTHGGRRCYGFKRGNIKLHKAEVGVLHQMAERTIGGHSYKEVAYWLNEQGHRTAEGKLWTPITVRNTLQRKRYAGIRVHHEAEYPAKWPAVFDPATWEALQLTIRLRREKHGDRPKARRYLLTGLAVCGGCGLPLNGETKRDHPGRPLRRTYCCRVQGATQKRRGCGGVTRNAYALEDFVIDQVFYRLDTPELAKLLRDDEPDDGHLSKLLERKNSLNLRLTEIVDDYAAAILTREQMVRAKNTAERELATVTREIDGLNRKRMATGLVPVGRTIRDAWDKSESDEWRRGLLALVVDHIVVRPGISKPFYKGKWRFDPDLIEIFWRA